MKMSNAPAASRAPGSVAEPLSPVDCIEEWNRPRGSGKVFDPNPKEG